MNEIEQDKTKNTTDNNLDLLLIKSGPGGIRGVFGGYSRGVRRVFGRNLVGNPRTGEAVKVESKAVPFFKTGKLLRDRLNGRA